MGDNDVWQGTLALMILKTLESMGYDVVCPSESETKFGAVETRPEARRCADLFRAILDSEAPHLTADPGLIPGLRERVAQSV